MWYAIRQKKTGKYLYGTNFRGNKYRQRLTDKDSPPMLFDNINLEYEIQRRKIDLRSYEVVEVDLIVKSVKKLRSKKKGDTQYA